MCTVKHTFKKNERISSKKDIELLFNSTDSFIAFPLRVLYALKEVETGSVPGVSVLISVSKKKIRKATARNHIKRQIREAYRLHKTDFLQNRKPKGKDLLIAFLYVGNNCSLPQFEEGIKKALSILSSKNL